MLGHGGILYCNPRRRCLGGISVILNRSIAVIEANSQRRAMVNRTLTDCGFHVELFESVSEITGFWPRNGMILVEDTGDTIQRLLEWMAQNGEWRPLVGFAETPDPARIVNAILCGAIDYVQCPGPVDQLTSAIAHAQKSGHRTGSIKLRESKAQSRLRNLTKREREVLMGVADGMSNRKIGQRLEISPRTVEIHRANMLMKMGAKHTSEAIRIAIEASIVG